MRGKLLPRNAVVSAVKSDFGCGFSTDAAQVFFFLCFGLYQ